MLVMKGRHASSAPLWAVAQLWSTRGVALGSIVLLFLDPTQGFMSSFLHALQSKYRGEATASHEQKKEASRGRVDAEKAV